MHALSTFTVQWFVGGHLISRLGLIRMQRHKDNQDKVFDVSYGSEKLIYVHHDSRGNPGISLFMYGDVLTLTRNACFLCFIMFSGLLTQFLKSHYA